MKKAIDRVESKAKELLKVPLSETMRNRLSLYMAARIKAETELNIYMQAILDSNGLTGDWNLNTKDWTLEPVIEPSKSAEGSKT